MTSLHLISHTHWDREWYQTFQQFRMRLVHLVDGLLELLAADPDYRYFMLDGQTIILDDYLALRPEKEAELGRYIQEGRILIGPWHILPDEFLVSPEAIVRNLLQGDRTTRRFGVKMMVGYIPDPFGHIGQMPQILRGFDIDSACLRRGLADEPAEINWQAPDGSTVFLAYLRDGYDNAAGLPTSEPDRFVSEVKRLRDSLAPHSTSSLQINQIENRIQNTPTFVAPPLALLLMHGTDHMEPPSETSKAIAYANGHLDGDRLVQSTLPDYLADVRQKIGGEPLLTVIGELRACKRHHLLPGVLSTRMWIKQRNRASETLLEAWAEPFTTWAENNATLLRNPGQAETSTQRLAEEPSSFIFYPSSFLRFAWRLLMECHPHDSICGCSIDQVHEEMRSRFDQVDQIGEEVTRQSLARLASSINTINPAITQSCEVITAETGKTSSLNLNLPAYALLVFNPISYSCSGLVTIPIELPPKCVDFEVLDEQGQPVPHQQQESSSVELIHISLDRKGLQDAMSIIHDGRAANMVVRGLQWQRQGDTMLVEVIMATSGEPDLEAWRRAIHESVRVFADDTIKTFLVVARTPPATEAAFVAKDVPAFGYRTYWLRPISAKILEKLPVEKPNRTAGLVLSLSSRLEKITRPFIAKMGPPSNNAKLATSTTAEKATESSLPTPSPDFSEGVVKGKKPPYAIENEFLRVEASTEDGTLVLLDKWDDVEYCGLNRFVDGGDCGDEYNYCPPETDRIVRLAFIDSIRVERGPIQQSVEISLHMRLPAELTFDRKTRSKNTVVVPILTRVTLTHGVPRADISTVLDNLGADGSARARDHRLRVHFPAPFSVQEADFDGHFEIVRRKLGLPVFDQTWVEQPRPEKPQRLFTSITGEACGLAIANRGLPEIEVYNNLSGNSELALTLLRCVGWMSRDDFANRHGHAGPALPTPGAQMPGKHTFSYSVMPYPAETPLAKIYALAAAFNAPLRGMVEPIHTGEMPASNTMIQVEPEGFAISAIKPCEDDSGWILRGYNLGDDALEVRLVPWKPFPRAERVNLSEKPIALLIVLSDGSVTFPVRGHEIVSIKFSKD